MIIFLPILGNSDGRILERVPSDQPVYEKLLEMLTRYGDFIPSNGTAELVDDNGSETCVYFLKTSPGVWSFTNTPPEQATLPGM